MPSASGGFAPLTRGSAPGPRWGHRPQTPIYALAPALAIFLASPFFFSQEMNPALLYTAVASGLFAVVGNGQPTEPALCQLYRRSVAPCGRGAFASYIFPEEASYTFSSAPTRRPAASRYRHPLAGASRIRFICSGVAGARRYATRRRMLFMTKQDCLKTTGDHQRRSLLHRKVPVHIVRGLSVRL